MAVSMHWQLDTLLLVFASTGDVVGVCLQEEVGMLPSVCVGISNTGVAVSVYLQEQVGMLP